jgi:hypothetical protein
VLIEAVEARIPTYELTCAYVMLLNSIWYYVLHDLVDIKIIDPFQRRTCQSWCSSKSQLYLNRVENVSSAINDDPHRLHNVVDATPITEAAK